LENNESNEDLELIMTKEEKSAIPENDDIGMSLIETIKSPDLEDLAQDFGEVALDSILKDGILKDIPVVSSIVGVAKAAISIRDKLLVKKLLHFLHELSDTTEEERRNFLQEFEKDPKEQRKVGENLILLLDRLDNMDKPAMVAKLLKAYIKREIENYDEFTFYSSVVDRSPIIDLSALFSFFSEGDIDEQWLAERFHYLGLSLMMITTNPKFRPEPENPSDAVTYRLLQEREPTNRANLRYKLSEGAYIIAKIILGDKYKHRELDLTEY
jgi:hypothetical protein